MTKTPIEIASLLYNPNYMGMAPAQGFSPQNPALPPTFMQPNVPMPRPRPVQAMTPMPAPRPQMPAGAPLSLAPPEAAPMTFSGANGPQWTDEQWQNYWARSTPQF